MSQDLETLDALRREIDSIDDRIHDLLMQRTDIVLRIAAIKGNSGPTTAVIRPGREAQILRRILNRHRGALPKAVVARIWRELIAALCRVQGPLSIAVLAPEKSVGYSDMARRHYGSTAQMSLYRSAARVLRAVSETPGTVGILPVPQDGDTDAWWMHLGQNDHDAPQVIAKLPFAPAGEGQFESLSALVVANAAPEESGADESLLMLRLARPVSRARAIETLRQSGLQARLLTSQGDAGGQEVLLLAIDGYAPADDPRFARAIESSGGDIDAIRRLGAYALRIED